MQAKLGLFRKLFSAFMAAEKVKFSIIGFMLRSRAALPGMPETLLNSKRARTGNIIRKQESDLKAFI